MHKTFLLDNHFTYNEYVKDNHIKFSKKLRVKLFPNLGEEASKYCLRKYISMIVKFISLFTIAPMLLHCFSGIYDSEGYRNAGVSLFPFIKDALAEPMLSEVTFPSVASVVVTWVIIVAVTFCIAKTIIETKYYEGFCSEEDMAYIRRHFG